MRMIARSYGKKISLKFLRSIAETNKLGVSLKDLTDAFGDIGMRSAALRISTPDIFRMPCPAIVYWRQSHFVVLYHIDTERNVFFIADPDEGKMEFPLSDFEKHWKGDADKGIVIVAEPDEGFHSRKFPSDNIFKGLYDAMREGLRENRKAFLWTILLSAISMGADLLMPLMLQNTVDKGIALRDIPLVWMLIAGQLAVFMGNAVSSYAVQFVMMKLGMKINLEMTGRYLRRLISLPLSFFDRKASADLIQKIDDQHRLSDFLMHIPGSTLFIILNMLVFSGLLIWYNGWLYLFFLALTVLEVGWTFLFLSRRRGLDYEYFTGMAENRNNIHEIINGMTEIKSSGAHGSRLRQWEESQRRLIDLSVRSRILSMKMTGGQSLIARIKEISITGICATLVIKGVLSFGEMLTVGYIIGRLSGPFHDIISMIGQTQDATLSYERLDEVLNGCPDPRPQAGYDNPGIEFRNVSFRYPGKSNPFVIRDMDLKIEPGTTTAIVGESGCGKTTLIKLMLGFYIPQKGTIRLGSTEISRLDRDQWLEHCGAVMQSGYIFSDTIMKNIALSSDDINPEKAKDAADAVGLSKFIETLPMGYDTRIGPTGLELSGGQKQRLLIARAIYKKPDILFLDEATSSLDAYNENRITRRILKIQKGKTLIISAHRLSTVKNADRILYMEHGRIIEQGTHDELISLRGRYFDLVSNQLEIAYT